MSSMSKQISPGALGAAVIVAAVAAGAGGLWLQGRQTATEEQRMLAEIERRFAPQRQQFRAYQDARMRGELSPLARVDYVHLKTLPGWPGSEALVGTTTGVPVPAEALAGQGGRLALAGDKPGELWVRAQPAVTVRRAGQAGPKGLKERKEESGEALRLGNGDVVIRGRARLLVAGLPDDPSVAVYDQGAAALTSYQGLSYYPIDARYMAPAELRRYPKPRPVMVESSRGGPQEQRAIGTLHFTLEGKPQSLEAFVESDNEQMLFLVFRDRSCGAGSYGAGRFLSTPILPNDQVILDFNQAWNPLCAYSKFFHCPMPPKQNHLDIAIPAGERAYPGSH